MIEFLFGWWSTPIIMWSIKTIVGFVCMLTIPVLPFAIPYSIYEYIKELKNEKGKG